MKRAGDIFSALFDEKMMSKAKNSMAFFASWENIVEKNGIASAASHTWIKNLDKGLVLIEVDHPGWKQILQTKASKLLSDFHYRFPDLDISGISIALSRPESQEENPISYDEPMVQEKSSFQYEPTDLVAENFVADSNNSEYDAIKDDKLKNVLMRLEQHIKERNR